MRLDEYAGSFLTAALERDAAGVLTVRLHYRDGPMRWTAVAHRELPRLLAAIDGDDANRVVVLTGTGDRFIDTPDDYGAAYRSGAVRPSDWERGFGEATRMLHGLADLRVPVVAALNGPVSGHSELVLLCDLVICTPDTYFEDRAHLPAGLVPGDGMQVLWPAVIGPVRARHFLLAGRRISASEALEWGVVGEVVAADELSARAAALAAQLASIDPLVLRHARQLLYRPTRRALLDELMPGLGVEAYVSLSQAPQFDEGERG